MALIEIDMMLYDTNRLYSISDVICVVIRYKIVASLLETNHRYVVNIESILDYYCKGEN